MQIDPSYYLNDSPTGVQGKVTGFEIHRSISSNTLYSVFAVGFDGEILYPVCVDVAWDWAVYTKNSEDFRFLEQST